MGWRDLLKFTTRPRRPRPPRDRPPVRLRIETQYELEGKDAVLSEGEDGTLPLHHLATVTYNDYNDNPIGLVLLHLTTCDDEPLLIINSVYGLADLSRVHSWSGTDTRRMRQPLSCGQVVEPTWNPIGVPLRCGWMPRIGVLRVDLMEATRWGSGWAGPWIGMTMSDANGRQFWEYYGEGVHVGTGHHDDRWRSEAEAMQTRQNRLRMLLEGVDPERLTCQL